MNPNHTLRTVVVLALLLVFAATALAQQEAVQSSPDRVKGLELYRQGKYAEASKALKKAVKTNKSDGEAWYYIGMALVHQKKWKDATKALETAVQLRPNSADTHAALGYALLLRNNLERALSEAQAARSIDPKLIDAHYIAGVCHLRLGHREPALWEAESILKLDPKFANAYLLKSQALVSLFGGVMVVGEGPETRRGRYLDAKNALEEYLKLSPNLENKEIWDAQLESLRFWAAPFSGPEQLVFSGKEVTTKARVQSKPEPSYTERARSNGVIGTVVLRAVFASDGKVKYIIVVSGLPDGLTEKAVEAARRIKFLPATKDGRPVSMFFQLEYNFNLY